jgi:DNA adenine methylase
MTLKSPLKWPGGKAWLAPLVSWCYVRSGARRFVEPFAGSAAAFFFTAPSRALLADRNVRLMNCYRVLRDDVEAVLAKLSTLSNSKECYERCRDALNDTSEIDRAAILIFLTKTSWGGIYRENKLGKFNVPYGNNGRRFFELDHIRQVSRALGTARLEDSDFEDSLAGVTDEDFVYLDPPYTSLDQPHSFARYTASGFTWDDQRRLAWCARACAKRGVKVMVSGPSSESFLALYPEWSCLSLSRNNSLAASKNSSIRNEIVLSSDPLAARQFGTVKSQRTKTPSYAAIDCQFVACGHPLRPAEFAEPL